MIQIDGLAREVLERAMRDGAAPSIGGLARRNGMELLSIYSGLPSTTPSVQGELFYGARCAVPAFAYLEDRRVARHMLEPSAAAGVEERLETRGRGLLAGGSSYCNIYTGGAGVTRFCPAGVSRSSREGLLARGAAYRLRALGAYVGVCVRAAIMMGGEIMRMLFGERHRTGVRLSRRISDAWDRILVSVALRDSSRLGALHDLRSGLPVVHVNFLGYDKLAHMYGPDSRPARRALKGIDRAVGSLLNELRERHGERGTAVVYSDHGQEPTTSIDRMCGAALDEIVRDVVRETGGDEKAGRGTSTQRVGREHGNGAVSRSLPERIGERVLGVGVRRAGSESEDVTTVQAGPIAHVYLADASQKAAVAKRIAERVDGAAVIYRCGGDEVSAWLGSRGPMTLGELCDRLEPHPFAEEIQSDLERLAGHSYAGDLVVVGTGFGGRMTFAPERGSHGGPGALETHAFVVAPKRFGLGRRSPLRFGDLREALLEDRGMGGGDSRAPEPAGDVEPMASQRGGHGG